MRYFFAMLAVMIIMATIAVISEAEKESHNCFIENVHPLVTSGDCSRVQIAITP